MKTFDLEPIIIGPHSLRIKHIEICVSNTQVQTEVACYHHGSLKYKPQCYVPIVRNRKRKVFRPCRTTQRMFLFFHAPQLSTHTLLIVAETHRNKFVFV